MGIIMICLHIIIAKWNYDDEMLVHLLGLWIIIYWNHIKNIVFSISKILCIEDHKRMFRSRCL